MNKNEEKVAYPHLFVPKLDNSVNTLNFQS